MEEKPPDSPESKKTKAEPLPNNASIVEEAVSDVPFGRTIWKFFVREGKVVRNGWGAFAIFLLIFIYIGSELRGCYDDSEIESLRDNLSSSNGAKLEAEGDRNKYQTLYNQDENSVGQLRQIANAKFAQSPPDKRIDLALQMLNEIDTKVSEVNPTNQKIATATATAIIQIEGSKVEQSSHYMGIGGMIALGSGATSLLVGFNQNHDFMQSDPEHGTLTLVCDASQGSSYMGKPIRSLVDTQYIQINLANGIVQDGSTITGGQVVWVINSAQTIKADIPRQSPTKGLQNSSQIMILNVEKVFAEQLSSNPYTSAFPH